MISYLRLALQSYTNRNLRKYSIHIPKMKYVKIVKDWKAQFTDALIQPDDTQKETWENMRKYVTELRLSLPNVDCLILHICKNERYVNTGIGYYKFLRSNNYNLGTIVTALYLELCSMKKDPLTEDERNEIINLSNCIMSQYQSLDANMSNILVAVLCKLDNWQEAIKIIEEFEKTDEQFLRHGYSALITYLFNCGNAELAYKYLSTCLKLSVGPTKETYSAYIKYCLKEKDKFTRRLEILFNLWSKYGTKPSKDVVYEYMMICNDNGWSAQLTTISRLKCKMCKKALVQRNLTENEYMILSKTVLKKLILNNMYYVTQPDEINHYMQFINARKPYDVVIDGLNVKYINRNGMNMLRHCLIYFKKKNKKTLVIGRNHMKHELKMQSMQNLADFFHVRDWSHDDLFLLYAAFSSGPNTLIISNDSMRQHKFAIGDAELDSLFKRWQASHQYTATSKGDKTVLTKQMQTDSIVQKQDDCWHLPYIPNYFLLRSRQKSNDDWACFNMCPR